MKTSTLLYTLLVGLLLVGPAAAQKTAESEIRTMLQQRDTEIKTLLGPDGQVVSDAKKERLRTVINGVIDFQAMGKAALGPHWEGLTPAQRTEFVTVFGDIVRGQSLANLDPYRARVSYKAVTVDGTTAHVVTETVYKDVPMVVEYDLVKAGDTWMATDIILDEVSTVEGYARSFQTMIRKRGFDTLMDRLRERRESLATQ